MRRHFPSSFHWLDARSGLPALLLAAATLVSGCDQSQTFIPDSGYTAIQDSPDEPQQLSPFEDVEADIAAACRIRL